jgi:hypothetical protein
MEEKVSGHHSIPGSEIVKRSPRNIFQKRLDIWHDFHENRSAMGAALKSKCKRGHRLAGWNLYLRKDGTRECRQCSLARTAKRDRQRRRLRMNNNGNGK